MFKENVSIDDGIFTQSNTFDDKIMASRKEIRKSFVEKQQISSDSYKKDLEASLYINKQIINDLLTGKNTVVKELNEENRRLIEKVQALVKERDEVEAKLLISQQIVEEYKMKEQTATVEYKQKEIEWIDQLNVKEYILQIYQYNINQSLKLLKPYKFSSSLIRDL